MKRLIVMLVASMALALAWGIDSALADGLPIPTSPTASPSQTATQSNDASNSANQTATSAPIVVSGPNVAIGNGGDGKSPCSPCGESSGTVNQNSGNSVDASTSNNAQQTNTQSNEAGQSQTVGASGCCDGKDKRSAASQSAEQSNSGSNEANQTATSAPVVVSGPNIAAFNSGDVNQNSGNSVDGSASNNADQTNTQSNSAGQSQIVSGNGCGCHSKRTSSEATQSAKQSNDASNSADQTATSAPIVVSGGNIAAFNHGDVNQNSGNSVDASTSNNAEQTNTQSNEAGQSQTVGASGCCHGKSKQTGASQSAEQSNSASNEANQTATSAPVVVSGPNVAAFNSGDVNQNSGNRVYAPASNTAEQTNRQSNSLDQQQTVKRGGSCCSKGGVEQTATQSNHASNEADQTATSAPLVVSGGNFAVAKPHNCGRSGDVRQSSGNDVDASSSNDTEQANDQSNTLEQSQTVDRSCGACCECRPRCCSNPCERSRW